LQEKEGEGEECKDEPDVKVQEEVLEVEERRLRAIEVRAASGGEDVVFDDVPRDNLNLLVEECVDRRVKNLDSS
jgi:hypothetical protein